MPMVKISAEKAAQVYAEVPGVLRALARERDDLKEKLASTSAELKELKRRDRIEKIAKSMVEKGLDPEASHEDRVARIEKAAAAKGLDVIEEAVGLSAPQKPLGDLGDELEAGNGASMLEAYLIGEVGR
jgi:hypothetical protein